MWSKGLTLLLLLLATGASARSLKCAQIFSGAEADKQHNAVFQTSLRATERKVFSLIDGYARRLGPYQDAFALVFDIEEGRRTFARLATRIENNRKTPSPLGLINRTINSYYLERKTYDYKLVELILDDADNLLKNSNSAQEYFMF